MCTSIVLVAICANGDSKDDLRDCLDSLVQQIETRDMSVSILVADTDREGSNIDVFKEYEKSSVFPVYYQKTEFPKDSFFLKATEIKASLIIAVSVEDRPHFDWLASFFDKAIMIIPKIDKPILMVGTEHTIGHGIN